jgi:transposase, IS5 family
MKIKLLETLKLKFEKTDWANNPEFGLIDTVLDEHPQLLKILEPDIIAGSKSSAFGRGDVPSVEQIVRAAIYKELKQLDYRELAYHQTDSRICATFVKIDELRPYSFQMYQDYISRIKQDNLNKFMIALNKIAIGEGLEDIKQVRQDSTVVETNIHYPTNNALVWDCIHESDRLLNQLHNEIKSIDYIDYIKGAKKTYFKINVIKNKDKRVELFAKQLITFTKCINQLSNAIKKKESCSSMTTIAIFNAIEKLLPVTKQVYSMTERREIKGETVPNDQKLFSIYEPHTDIIVKGSRKVEFGHKVNLATGASNLVLNCTILRGNPCDKDLYQPTIDQVVTDYGVTPRDIATDGGYATKKNSEYAVGKGIINVVFNKIVGSLKNIVSSKNIETRLKKWRSGIEANISNIKRGFGIDRCNWKGFEHFTAKVMWSIIGYNIRVMTNTMLLRFKTE